MGIEPICVLYPLKYPLNITLIELELNHNPLID